MFPNFCIQDILSLFFGECVLLYTAFFVLGYNIYYYSNEITGEMLSRSERTHTGTVLLVVLGLIFSFLMLFVSNESNTFSYCNQFFCVSFFENWVLVSVTILGIVILFLGKRYLEEEALYNYEYYVLFLLYLIGLLVLIKSVSLISVYLGIEIVGLTSYVLASYKRYSEYSIEAGLKYFVLGVFGSAFLLLSTSLLYLVYGTIDINELSLCVKYLFTQKNGSLAFYGTSSIAISFLLGAFLFKLGIAPFHVWVPDVYEGSPTIVTLIFSTLPKIVFFAFLLKLFLFFLPTENLIFSGAIHIMCLLSILMGTFLALFQTRIKRFFAYSSIVHAGYLLLVVHNQTTSGLTVFFFYLIFYIVTLVGVFSLILSFRVSSLGVRIKYLSELRGLWKVRPVLAVGLTVFLCSFAGIPPLVGFLGKLYVLLVLLQEGSFLFAVVLILSSVFGVVYYLHVIKTLYFSSPSREIENLTISPVSAYVFSLTSCLLILGIFCAEWILYSCDIVVLSLII